MTEKSWDDPLRSALFTDLYQLTMAQAYDAEGMDRPASFELFFRSLPPSRNYVVAAGLEDVLDYLESFQFSDDDIQYLRCQEKFLDSFLSKLRDLRFTGEVHAVPEGTVVFPHEPLVRVVAPIMQAQLVETFILNQIHFQSIAATKASRVVIAAGGRKVVDFGSRRAHGADAALKVARASYLAGASGTSNVLAGKRYGVPIFGTMAHSYIQAHDDEAAALENFARTFPHTTLLVDTYDTLDGVRKVISLREKLGEAFAVRAVRLDSGDLAELAGQTRRMLDDAGLAEVRIFASSGLDEYKVAKLVAADAPIDGFGVGTNLAVSNDAPALDMAYKLVQYAGRPRMKLSSGKILYPGTKQVFRRVESDRMVYDVVGCEDEPIKAQLLLQPVMRHGQRLPAASPPLSQVRTYARQQFDQLPAELQSLEVAQRPYEVRASDELEQRRRQVERFLETHGRSPRSAPQG